MAREKYEIVVAEALADGDGLTEGIERCFGITLHDRTDRDGYEEISMNCALTAAAVIENATRAGQPPRPARDLAVHDHSESNAHATPRRALGVSAIHELVMRAGQRVDALGV
jgi:hypothetical protein